MSKEVIFLENISKSFSNREGEELEILKNINLSIREGDSISISGKSGCGKSTLLQLASLIEKPTSGKVFVKGKDTSSLKERELTGIRRSVMGFVFQNSLLLEDFNALENVAFPLLNSGKSKKDSFLIAGEMLESLGMKERITHRPSQLSGGERQRVAIARALVAEPEVIFADEPTGALDEDTAANIEELLLSAVRDRNMALVLVTHNPLFAQRCAIRYRLSHKELLSE